MHHIVLLRKVEVEINTLTVFDFNAAIIMGTTTASTAATSSSATPATSRRFLILMLEAKQGISTNWLD
jgi:hypothetical protein